MTAIRNARPSPAAPARRSRRDYGGTLLGVFIGMVIGLGMAASVAFWLMKNNPAFQVTATTAARDAGVKESPRAAKSDVAEKPRFDFYKILPGGEDTRAQAERKQAEKPDRAVAEQSKEKAAVKPAERVAETVASPSEKIASIDKAPKSGEKFWLQAGSFSTEQDADNLKARLAFAGWEASVQQGIVPDKTSEKAVRYRVRLGPYDNQDEMQRIKAELGKRGFEATVMKF